MILLKASRKLYLICNVVFSELKMGGGRHKNVISLRESLTWPDCSVLFKMWLI